MLADETINKSNHPVPGATRDRFWAWMSEKLIFDIEERVDFCAE